MRQIMMGNRYTKILLVWIDDIMGVLGVSRMFSNSCNSCSIYYLLQEGTSTHLLLLHSIGVQSVGFPCIFLARFSSVLWFITNITPDFWFVTLTMLGMRMINRNKSPYWCRIFHLSIIDFFHVWQFYFLHGIFQKVLHGGREEVNNL